MSRPRKNREVNALTSSMSALSVANTRGRTRVPPPPIDEEAVYREVKDLVRTISDPLERNTRVNRVLNPIQGGEVSSKMLLKIAVELCTDIRGIEDEIKPSSTMAQTERAQQIFKHRLHRKTDPTVIAVGYNDLAWMGECIRRYDLNLKQFNAAVLERAGKDTYKYLENLTGRARSSRPNRRSGLPPPYPSRSQSLVPYSKSRPSVPYPEVEEDLAASKVVSQYRSDSSRVPLPLPRVDMPSYRPSAVTAGKARGTSKGKNDSDSGSDSASCSSDSDTKDCSDRDEKKDDSDDDDDDDRAKNHASESEASSSSGSDSD